jgi:hypothetical protein
VQWYPDTILGRHDPMHPSPQRAAELRKELGGVCAGYKDSAAACRRVQAGRQRDRGDHFLSRKHGENNLPRYLTGYNKEWDSVLQPCGLNNPSRTTCLRKQARATAWTETAFS